MAGGNHFNARVSRALAVAALALAALATPAAAQGVDEECAQNAPSAAVCTGLHKLGERGSAECRRAGVPDESCYPPTGRRVNRAEVEAYKSSEVHRALAFQYELARDVPLSNAPWVGTHNSFNSPSEMPTLSHTDSNQQLSLTEQLDIDVRSLELDVHWFRSARAGGQEAPVVCHARPPSEQNAGCTTERLLGEVLSDIAGWLNRPGNGEQVLLLYLEDAVQDTEGYAETVSRLEGTLERADGSSLIYHPGGESCTKLPLDLARADVLAAGAQVVLVGGCAEGWSSAVFDWNGPHVESGDSSGFRDFPDCDPHRDRATYDGFLVRYFEDSTWLSAAVSPTDPPDPDAGITAEKAGAMARCGVDLLGMDQLLPRDGRLEALVWSWGPGEPSAGGGECTVQRGDGRWAARPCTVRRPAACRSGDGGWTVTGKAVKYSDADKHCMRAGASFDPPRTGYENSSLRAGAGTSEVWLPSSVR